jgi:predicted lipoprotein with Yx(FWY)xxD motif
MRRLLAADGRRRVLMGALTPIILGIVGVIPAPASGAIGQWTFVSAPSLHPPKVKVDVNKLGADADDVLLAPFKDFASKTPQVGQTGALILDTKGNPVWFRPIPATQEIEDLQTQTLGGKPVLTWWQGTVALPGLSKLPAGTSEPGAVFYIYSNRYKQIRKITARNGYVADGHEFTITPRDTALFAATKVVNADLAPYGGPLNGKLVDSAIQEISLKTGKLVFQWSMLGHVSPKESQVPVSAGAIWDTYHMNSIDEDTHGHLLISARNTSAIYELSHTTGKLLWQLGGTGSTYKLANNATFSWQHDARFAPNSTVTLFDDACCDLGVPDAAPDHPARGLVLKLTAKDHTATVAHQYEHQPLLDVPSQGNMQTLPNGSRFIGWGQLPYYSEYTAAGKRIYEVRLPAADESYRTLQQPWSANPSAPPSAAVGVKRGKTTVYASWNGATAVRSWQVLAGTSTGSLQPVGSPVRKAGFETAIATGSTGPLFAVRALNGAGRMLRSSGAVRASSATVRGIGRRVSAASTTTIATTRNKKLGVILVSSNGHAVYLFSKDTKGADTCSGSCPRTWTALLANGTVGAKSSSGLSAKLIGTTKLANGKRQVTYNHHPLYLDKAETKSGTAKGEGADQFGGHWYVVNRAGKQVKPKHQNPSNPCNPVCTGY